MPSCSPDVIGPMLHAIMYVKPTKILDVGVGNGKWGFLCEEYLKYWCGITPFIYGVEPFSDYQNHYNWAAYSDVYLVTIQHFLEEVDEEFDLIIMSDVLEHLDKKEAYRVLKDLLKITKYVLISTPNGFRKQDECFDNKYEIHKSGFTKEDFHNPSFIGETENQLIVLLEGELKGFYLYKIIIKY